MKKENKKNLFKKQNFKNKLKNLKNQTEKIITENFEYDINKLYLECKKQFDLFINKYEENYKYYKKLNDKFLLNIFSKFYHKGNVFYKEKLDKKSLKKLQKIINVSDFENLIVLIDTEF